MSLVVEGGSYITQHIGMCLNGEAIGRKPLVLPLVGPVAKLLHKEMVS